MNNIEKNSNKLIKSVVGFLICFISIPYYFNIFFSGLDGSGKLGVNYAVTNGWKFGDAIEYSFGPLGFLAFPMNIDNIPLYALIFWGLIWGAFLAFTKSN